MKITKYQHACFALEEQGSRLVVDPGAFTTDFTADESIVAVIITHIHADHFQMAALEAIKAKNPQVVAVSLPEITAQLVGWQTAAAEPGQTLDIGPFHLAFFGGSHATIHPDIQATGNVGVLINDSVYYPGDSFAPVGLPVKLLALPVSAPWLKISEAMDFLMAVRPEMTFPTHDAILSDIGKNLVDNLLSGTADKLGSTYRRLDGLTVEI